MKTAYFTGHRPSRLDNDYDGIKPIGRYVRSKLEEAIIKLYREHGTRHFITGMALGVDQWAAEVVIRLRDLESYDLHLHAYVPFLGQERIWPKQSQKRYWNILDCCDEILWLKVDPPANKAQASQWLMERNTRMADDSDACIAVWDGSKSGTADAVQKAKDRGLFVVIINPRG